MQDMELLPPELPHATELGRIAYEAFRGISETHGFEADFRDAETAAKVIGLILSLPSSFRVAARIDGRFVGSNFMLLTDQVAGLGPITVDPAFQGRGVGRRLMQAALDYAAEHDFEQVRLLQASYNTASISLYASVGFDVREPIGVMKASAAAPDQTVRPARVDDLAALEDLCVRFYKMSRRNELAAWMARGFPVLAREVQGHLRGYLVPGKLGHGVAETTADALALISQITRHSPPGLAIFFCPLRNASLYRATLKSGCRLIKIMTLMTLGPYAEPTPVWMPSIAF